MPKVESLRQSLNHLEIARELLNGDEYQNEREALEDLFTELERKLKRKETKSLQDWSSSSRVKQAKYQKE